MIRIEYTIDGKSWNHKITDFNSLVDANKWIEQAGIRDYASKIKFLTVTEETTLRIRVDKTDETISKGDHL